MTRRPSPGRPPPVRLTILMSVEVAGECAVIDALLKVPRRDRQDFLRGLLVDGLRGRNDDRSSPLRPADPSVPGQAFPQQASIPLPVAAPPAAGPSPGTYKPTAHIKDMF